MARDKPELDDNDPGTSGPENVESSSNDSLLGRRSYLKLAGTATAASAALVAGSASTAAGSDYEVIEADNTLYRLDEGETFENKIIDYSNGNYFTLLANEVSNWQIRNVAFVGQHAHDQHTIVVRNDGGPGLIENVYMADGCTRPSSYSSHGQCGIFVHRQHEGHVTIRHCNIQDWPNNGIYANPPYYENGGSVRIEECLSANNYVSNFRIGSSGSEVVDSVAYNDSSGQFRGRCLWAWGADIEARGCAFDSGSYPNAIHVRDSTQLTVQDTVHDGYNYGGSGNGNVIERGSTSSSGGADLTPPDGVPMTPEEAVTGESSDGSFGGGSRSRGDYEDLQHTYEFDADGEDEPTDYYFEIEDGPIEPSTYNGATVEEDFMWVSDDGTRAAGRVVDGRHAWEFDTPLVDVTVEGSADPIVDDNPSHLSRYPLSGASGDDWKGNMPWHTDFPDLQHTYEFDAEGEDEPTDYYFEVEDGPIEPSTYNDATIEPEYMWVSDDGTRAAGRVVDGRHAWEFDTPLVDVTVEGSAEPFVDDNPSHLSRYPLSGANGDAWKGDMPWHGEEYEHTILIDGVGTTGKSNYEFSVTGDIESSTDHGASINDDTAIDGGHVTGSVRGWRDAFVFNGDLDTLTVDGEARVLVDGEAVDTDDYADELERVLTVVGNGSPASYEVDVSGGIKKLAWDDFGDQTNVVSTGTVEGSIESGVQRFRFSGSVTDLTFTEGSAHVYADQDRIQPDDF
ncbi:hypothetical protein GS429_14790 [Natronorubrum sp. JWXQ-INN-674]|uniref:Right handed beta helix domain-containing protein n=1 Tax=Natronorubrum halalkaliphilum TaxID=2691917 RepID=A0A6B0VS21_9EURY|nr:right-handed parallel beta-helix repeat-containing protein [Natronorubrum halalkaliphilum]MXV63309.1 hypothetical protein [Natronorubrum halalkaliphilum]